MKIGKLRISTILGWITIICMVGYIIYFGYLFAKGQSPYKNQKLLLIEVAVGILLTALPMILEKIWKFHFPQTELVFYFIFMFMLVLLGSGLQFYGIFQYWDKYEHILAGIMLAGIGYAIFHALSNTSSFSRDSPFLVSLFGFCFGGTCGVLWEMYEFTADGIANLNLQRYMNDAGQMLLGRAALIDTMGDLIADIIGALVMAIIGYIILTFYPNQSEDLYFKSTRQNIFSSMHF
mgnify:FL=1